eukprot:231715-Amphidinium_carterae.2
MENSFFDQLREAKAPIRTGRDMRSRRPGPGHLTEPPRCDTSTHRSREVAYQVRVLGQEAATQDVYSDMSCRAVVWTVLNESVERNQSLLEGVSVRLEEGIDVAGDTHRHSSFRCAVLPYGLSTKCEPLNVRGTRASHRTCGSPYVKFAGVKAETTWTKGSLGNRCDQCRSGHIQ